MLLLQGLSEFLEKYTEVAWGLTGRGFEVMSFDWRGQGHSPPGDGSRAMVFERHLADLAEVLDGQWPGEPPLLLAHSMGGTWRCAICSGGRRRSPGRCCARR